MSAPPPNPRPRARIIGPGQVVTIENPVDSSRAKFRIARRDGRDLLVYPFSEGQPAPAWARETPVVVRAARPFGLFLYAGQMAEMSQDGTAMIRLQEGPPRRRQLRGYFRMPVRLGVMLETEPGEPTVILRARNLSGSGILVMDPESRLVPQTTVRLGLPVGNAGELLRLPARVVRAQEGRPRRVALSFQGISEGARQMLLRYLVREHRRRQSQTPGCPGEGDAPRILPLQRR